MRLFWLLARWRRDERDEAFAHWRAFRRAFGRTRSIASFRCFGDSRAGSRKIRSGADWDFEGWPVAGGNRLGEDVGGRAEIMGSRGAGPRSERRDTCSVRACGRTA